jgi:hypothetical protein
MQDKSQDGVEAVEQVEDKRSIMILSDKDFINCPEFNNSINELLTRSPKKKFSDAFIRKILMIESQEKLDLIYNIALGKLRDFLKKGDDE